MGNFLTIRPAMTTASIVFIHMAVWFWVGMYTFHTVSLDSVEMVAWSRSLDFGYYKHPPMPAVILAVFTSFFDTNSAVFLASQTMVGFSALGIWVLANRMTSPKNSMVAVVLFLLIPYYNLDMVYFNHNPVQLPFWIWTIVTFDWVLRRSVPLRWFVFGIVAGVSLYTKYTIGILYITIGLYTLLYRRDCLRVSTISSFAIGFGGIVLPHIVWLFDTDFMPFTYVGTQTAQAGQTASFGNVVYFVVAQIGVMIFVVLGLGCGYPFGQKQDIHRHKFLTFMVFVPVLLIACIAVLGGLWLKTNWGFPLVGLLPLWLVMLTRKIHYKAMVLYGVCGVVGIALLYGWYYSNRYDRGDFPARPIAQKITTLWQKNVGTSLRYVSGDAWIGGVVSAYSKTQPKLIIGGDIRINRWVDMRAVKRAGYMIVSDTVITRGGIVVHGSFVQKYHVPYTNHAVKIYWAIVMPVTK